MSAQPVALVSRDPQLAAEVRRLCAMAGQSVVVAASPVEAVRSCRSAAMVVVDAESGDLLDAVTQPAGPDVVVVTEQPDRVSVWAAAVRVGARRVLTLPAEAAELLDMLALAGERPGLPGPLIGVVGGRGGVGASTLSVALAWATSRRPLPATVVDLDACGGGLDVVLGLEQAAGLRWPELRGTRGVVPSAALREQLPIADGIAVVSHGRPRGSAESAADEPADRHAVACVIDAARRAGGVVVADLPRKACDVVDAVVADCTTLLLVVPADVRGVAAATVAADRLRSLCADIRIVVRLDGHGRLRSRDVVTALGIDLAATVRSEPGLTAAVDRAQLLPWLRRSRLGRTAGALVDAIVGSANESP